MAKRLLLQWICCRSVGLHRRLTCLRKPIVQTFGRYNFSGTVPFALPAGMGLKYSYSKAELSFLQSNPVRFRQISQPAEGKYMPMGLPVTVNYLHYSFYATFPQSRHLHAARRPHRSHWG